jgi:hypothetical protein
MDLDADQLLTHLTEREQFWLARNIQSAAAVCGGLTTAIRRGDFNRKDDQK